ncbi:MAG TPA: glycosyltransferase [Myxococcaceae bacterium]|nr:glycosyltransferase [Myxococcaceae bacterium]
MVVHQLVPHFRIGDPTAQAAVQFQVLLRRLGHWGGLFSVSREPGTEALVQPLEALRVRAEDLLLLHHGVGSQLPGRLLHTPGRRGVVFHGLPPLRFHRRTSLEPALLSGRAQLSGMAPHVGLGIGLSGFGAAELRRAGYANVHTVPLFVEPERFGPDRVDPALRTRLGSAAFGLVSVGPVAPHARVEDLLALHREVLRIRPDARLVVAGEVDRRSPAMRALEVEAARTPGVTLLGQVSHAERVAVYRSGSVFVSMGEHEGSGVPLLEAMAGEVPVLAYAAGAVPETLDGAGIGFDEKRFALLAELAVQLGTDARLRARILAGQRRRLQAVGADRSEERLGAALDSVGVPRPSRTRARRRRPRVGIIVQRYGPEITGGAEAHAAQVVGRMLPHWELRVLTSCATDHLTWANALPSGESTVDGVPVLRFPNPRPRRMRELNALSRRLFGRSLGRDEEEAWMALQGPLLPGLWRHLAERGGEYDGFVAFTYLYVSTAWSVPLVADRTLLVPTAHDEEPLAFDAYAEVFERPRALLVNTPEELELIQRRFPRHARARVVGVGVDPPAVRAERFRGRFELPGDYLLYVGRVERGKGIPELLRAYGRLRATVADAPALVLAGEASMDIRAEGVRVLGRVSEQEKWDGLAGALAAVVPSAKESLSLLALEAFAVGTPVLGNAESPVVRGHLERSRAGLAYEDAPAFVGAVARLQRNRAAMARAARRYASRYGWARVVDAYREEMDAIVRPG